MIAHKSVFAPCNVFDGDGNPVHDLQWVDTETGEAEQTVKDANGIPQIASDHKLATAHVWLKLPIRLEPIGQAHRESLKQRGLI